MAKKKTQDVLIRDLDASVVQKLKRRAARQGRSLQAELREVLEESSRLDWASAWAAADRIRRRLAGRTFSDSTELIRQDRDR